MPNSLSSDEWKLLFQIAENSVQAAVNNTQVKPLDIQILPVGLQNLGASFVTLTKKGQLRGCIGTLEAYQPLALDVQERAAQAAIEDPRFKPVAPQELPFLEIEISYLTSPEPLVYERPLELIQLLRPHIDGVILQDGFHRATFLPQVWDQLPDVEDFLSHLCVKMGGRADLWKQKVLEVKVYQVEEFKQIPKW